MRGATAISLLVLLAWLPGRALAHPSVDRVMELVEGGDYEAAGPAIDEALERDDLSRADLLRIYEAQALLSLGADDEAGLDSALRALASIAPGHAFGPRFPPSLAERSEALVAERAGPVEVSTETRPSAVGVRLEARVDHDTESLVRGLRYRVFDAPSGEWHATEPPLEAAPGRTLLVFVEALGPGGAVLATAGSPDAPLRLEGVGAPEPDAPPAALSADEPSVEGGVDGWLVFGLTAAGVALVVGSIVLAVVLVEESPASWQPSFPREN